MNYPTKLATLFLLGALPLGAMAAEPPSPTTGGTATQSTPAPATAPAAKEPLAPLFSQLDVNKDGQVTKEEAKRSAEVMARFKEVDADHDGKISAAEFKNGMQAKL